MLRVGVAVVLALALGASSASAQGDPTLYCQGDGGPLGIASDAEHSVVLGEAPLPRRVRTSTVSVDGVATRVIESGPAGARDAIVFVHGHPGSARDFDDLVVAGGRFARTVALDISGYGMSDHFAAQVQSVDGAAAYIKGALAQLGVDRAVLVLHDFGGIWGLQWAAQNPDALTGVVLLGTGVLIDYVPHPLAVTWATPVAGESQMASTTRDSFKAALQGREPRRLPEEFVERMYDNYDRPTRCAGLRYYRSASQNLNIGREQAAVLRQRRRPALVLWGGQDPYIPPEHAERQREAFPDAQVEIFDDSGHWLFVDNADKTKARFVRFLQPALEVSRPRHRARRVSVRVRSTGVLPVQNVRARLDRRSTRPLSVAGSRRLVVRLRRSLRPGLHVLVVSGLGVPSERFVVRVRRGARPQPGFAG